MTAAAPRTGRTFKITAFVLLVGAFAGSFAVSIEEPPTVRPIDQDILMDQSSIPMWVVQAICGIGALLAGVWALRHRHIPSRAQLLKGFVPTTFEDCPLCGGQLLGGGEKRCCAACGADESVLVLDS